MCLKVTLKCVHTNLSFPQHLLESASLVHGTVQGCNTVPKQHKRVKQKSAIIIDIQCITLKTLCKMYCQEFLAPCPTPLSLVCYWYEWNFPTVPQVHLKHSIIWFTGSYLWILINLADYVLLSSLHTWIQICIKGGSWNNEGREGRGGGEERSSFGPYLL